MADSAASQLATDLSRAKSPEDYNAALRRQLAAFNALQESETARSGVKLACGAGCAICCVLRVDVFAHEVFLIADYLRKRSSPAELAELMPRLRAHREKVVAITPFEHVSQNIVCPLLRDGNCSVYPVRPHTCRRQHSTDLKACQYTYDHPEDLEFPGARDRNLFRSLSEAMQRGAQEYANLGYDTTIYELGSALTEALENPACWRRWRDGKKAFLKASVTPAA